MGMDDTTHTRGKGAGVKKEEAQAKTLTTTNHKDNEPQDNHRPFSFLSFPSIITSNLHSLTCEEKRNGVWKEENVKKEKRKEKKKEKGIVKGERKRKKGEKERQKSKERKGKRGMCMMVNRRKDKRQKAKAHL